jgi:acyl-CoA thioesterase-2
MNRLLQDLVNLLDLEALEDNMFRGQSRDLGGKSVFGGQVISQALVAAGRTVEESTAHSLHAYFLRPGDMALPIIYEVDRVRDGRSFTARRVQAIQHGQPILSMIVSFQRPEGGVEHQVSMPEVPPPESLRSMQDLSEEWVSSQPGLPQRAREAMLRAVAIEFRPVDPWNPLQPQADSTGLTQNLWFRASGTLPDDPKLHRCVLAYASDFNLLSTALRPHAMSFIDPRSAIASIDHALWFHRDVRTDDWLLYSMDSPSAQGARGLSRGLIFERGGRLVASVVQENLMRLLQPGS